MSAIDLFHDHLDECERCREHPFDPCAVGATRLLAAASAIVAPLKRRASPEDPSPTGDTATPGAQGRRET